MTARRLQDWYHLVNRVYVDRNFYRSIESIHCHLVEVSRGLAAAASRRRKRDLDPAEFLPKTLAWWLALCGRAGVQNIEQMLWIKFPNVCPYCRLPKHDGRYCKESDPTKGAIDWEWLKAHGENTEPPDSLAAWQHMFNEIYPRADSTDHEMNVSRMAEELGELAEAVRTLSVAPEYFVSEAPDVFAWLMGFANQFDFDNRVKAYGAALERWMESEYPGLCKYCHRTICKCPPVPSSTLGRIAKEAPRSILERGRLISLQESIALFRTAEESILIDGEAVVSTPSELSKLLRDIKLLLSHVAEQQAGQPAVSLAASLGAMREQVASASEITQGAVNGVIEAASGLDATSRLQLSKTLDDGESEVFRRLASYLRGMTGLSPGGKI